MNEACVMAASISPWVLTEISPCVLKILTNRGVLVKGCCILHFVPYNEPLSDD